MNMGDLIMNKTIHVLLDINCELNKSKNKIFNKLTNDYFVFLNDLKCLDHLCLDSRQWIIVDVNNLLDNEIESIFSNKLFFEKFYKSPIIALPGI